jgi:hypothetical protein
LPNIVNVTISRVMTRPEYEDVTRMGGEMRSSYKTLTGKAEENR